MTEVDRFIQFCESDFGAEVMDREAAYVRDRVSRDDLILDVGCGIGSLEERMSAYDIVGLDLSEEMVRAASKRVSKPFVRGDARRLPVVTGGIDAVVFIATLEFIPEVEVVLSETTRVLADDGTFVALILNARSEYVQSHLEREGSYFQRMVHRDTDQLTSTVFEYMEGTREPVLDIDGETIQEPGALETAALTVIAGSPSP